MVPEGLAINVHGEGADIGERVARDESHLVVRSMRATFAALGHTPSGLQVECVNRIPHAAGWARPPPPSWPASCWPGRWFATAPSDSPTPPSSPWPASSRATPTTSHPCLLGGLTIAWTDGGHAHAVRRDLDPAVVPVVLVPAFTASTELARGLLPATVPHADAAFAAGRAALLVAALTGSPDALLAATEDRLHQGLPGPGDGRRGVVDDAAAGPTGYAAVISGAGPSVLVLARGEVEAEAVPAAAPDGWAAHVMPVDTTGACVVSGPAGTTRALTGGRSGLTGGRMGRAGRSRWEHGWRVRCCWV